MVSSFRLASPHYLPWSNNCLTTTKNRSSWLLHFQFHFFNVTILHFIFILKSAPGVTPSFLDPFSSIDFAATKKLNYIILKKLLKSYLGKMTGELSKGYLARVNLQEKGLESAEIILQVNQINPPRQWQIWVDCSWLSESDEGSIE